jgi:hypothetical protein
MVSAVEHSRQNGNLQSLKATGRGAQNQNCIALFWGIFLVGLYFVKVLVIAARDWFLKELLPDGSAIFLMQRDLR